MPKLLPQTLVLALVMLFAVGCGGDSPDKLMEDQVSLMEKMVVTFENIKDVDSAKANADAIADIAKEMKDIEKRANELEKPSDEDLKKLKEKYKERIGAVVQKMFGEMARIQGLGKEVETVLDEAYDKVESESAGMPDWLK